MALRLPSSVAWVLIQFLIFERFLDSIQARGVMYGSNEHSRDRLHDQVIWRALNEFDRYWKYVPDGWER